MINIAVEGESDRGAASAIVRSAGHDVGKIRVAGGKSRLDPLVSRYIRAAHFEPWVVFRDADSDCPVELRRRMIPTELEAGARFAFRVARTMTEAWLLADRETFAEYFRVSPARVPAAPEDLVHGKRALLDLVSHSRSRGVREDVVAADGRAGPLFVERINDYASTTWRPHVAAESSDSLNRALLRITEL